MSCSAGAAWHRVAWNGDITLSRSRDGFATLVKGRSFPSMSSAPPADPRPDPDRWRWAGWLLALVLVVHTVQSVRIFPTVRSIVDPGKPVLVVDHALHLYHGALG